MVTITNTRVGGIGLPNGALVPGSGSAEVDAKDWSEAKKHPVIAAHLKDGVLTVGDELKEQEPAAGAYEVKETSSGWFAVTQDGKPVTKSLRKDDLKDFDAMSAEDKAAFVELHKAA